MHGGGRADGGARSQGGRLLKDIFRPVRGPRGTVLMSTTRWRWRRRCATASRSSARQDRRRRDRERPGQQHRAGDASLEELSSSSLGARRYATGRGVGRGRRPGGVTQPSLWGVLEPVAHRAAADARGALSRLGSAVHSGVARCCSGRHIRLLYKILKALEQVPDVGPLLGRQDPGGRAPDVLRHPGAVERDHIAVRFSSRKTWTCSSRRRRLAALYSAKLGETLLHSFLDGRAHGRARLPAYGVVFRGGPLFVPTRS